jgi:hypothetical protein
LQADERLASNTEKDEAQMKLTNKEWFRARK